MVGLWIGGLAFGLIAGWAFLRFAYDDPEHGDRGAVDPAYAAQISTMRATSATGTAGASPAATEASEPSASTETSTDSTTLRVDGTEPAATTAVETPMATQPPETIRGTGTTVTDPLTLSDGIVLLTSSHTGEGRFQVTLFDQSGNQIARVANGSGSWSGSGSAVVPADGQYLFEVVADGDWSIEAAPLVLDTSSNLTIPLEQSGSGSQVLPFVAAEPGTYRLHATCETGSLGIVLTSHTGSSRRSLISTTCPFDGVVAFPVAEAPVGYYLLDIVSSGDWTLRIE